MLLKKITNEDFLQLVCLNAKMYHPEFNSVGATATLLALLKEEDFIALGLYDEEVLVGFTHGHKLKDTVFYFSGIYVEPKNRLKTKEIIDFSFAHIRHLGYTAWEVDTSNPNVSSIMEKYGAAIKSTKYYKEF